MSITISKNIFRVNCIKNSKKLFRDEIVKEANIELYINNDLYAVFVCSPIELKELIVGYLLSNGIIEEITEITNLKIIGDRVNVNISKNVSFSLKNPKYISTSCFSERSKLSPKLWMKEKFKFKKNISINFESKIIIESIKILNNKSKIFKETGGTHASIILDRKGKVIAFSEDIGRHNTIDKVIGKIASENLNFTDKLLGTTGRLTSEMVLKASMIGIPIIISKSAPSDKAIKIGEILDLSLIGFARGKRFNIYTNAQRILV